MGTEPNLDDLQQDEPKPPSYGPVCVVVDGPVQTRDLPRRAAGDRNLTVRAGDQPRVLVGEDLRRSRLLVSLSVADPAADYGRVLIGRREEVQAGTAFILTSTGNDKEYFDTEERWIGPLDGDAVQVSFHFELWTE